MRDHGRTARRVVPVEGRHIGHFGRYAPCRYGLISGGQRLHAGRSLPPLLTGCGRFGIAPLNAQGSDVIEERHRSRRRLQPPKLFAVTLQYRCDLRGFEHTVRGPAQEVEQPPLPRLHDGRPLIERPEDHPFGAGSDRRPKILRCMRRRGTVGNIAAGGDVSALQFGDPERIAECVVTDDIRHQGDAERIFALAEHAEMPAQVQRCADRGEEFRVGRKVVIGQRAQNLVRIDMSPALRIEPFDQLRDMVQIPRRIVGQELLLREIGFQITLPALFRREVRQPAVIDLPCEVGHGDARPAAAGFVLQHPCPQRLILPEMRHHGRDIIVDFAQVRLRTGEFETAHVVQLVGDGKQRGEKPDAVFVRRTERLVVKREIPLPAAVHVRSEHPDTGHLHPVIAQQAEKSVDILRRLSRLYKNLSADLRHIALLGAHPGRSGQQ